MGTVRREGDWRLEKREDGVYEITHKNRSELKILTADYQPSGLMDERNDFSIQIREVESFSDAEQLFHEMAQGAPSTRDFDTTIPRIDEVGFDNDLGWEDNGDLPDLPPGGFFFVGAIAGGFLLQQAGLVIESPLFIIGVGLLFLPIAVLGRTYHVYRTEGTSAALEYFVSVDHADEETQLSSSEDSDSPEKTPPTPESMKDDIYFERANQHCEWCDERTDSPEIHHIKPRSEGGPNDYENLIGLCPGCHRKADKGGISRTKLRSKVSRQMDSWSKKQIKSS